MASKQRVIQIFYDEKQNIFLDEFGEPIYDVFEFLTPNDLYLFRSENARCSSFTCRHDPDILCEIIDLVAYPGDGYFNNRKGEYDEYKMVDMPCNFWPGVICRVSGGTDAERREICAYCRG